MNWILNLIDKTPAVVIDGLLYMSAGLFAFLMTQFGNDEAAKWVEPKSLFWLKTWTGAMANASLNLKMFRSNALNDYRNQKKNGNGVTPSETKP